MARFEVSPAAAHELLSACRLLFSDAGAEHGRDRLLSDAQTSGLFVARDTNGRLRAAALVQVLPGALGVAWLPRGDSRKAVDAVTSAACEWLRSRGVKVCQAFASVGEVADMAPLEQHRFRHTTQLVFLRRDVSDTSLPAQPQPPLEWGDEGRPMSDEFRRVLLATHEGSFDCPELTGARTPEEVLAGFDAPAPGGGLSLYRDGGEPVGVVICTESTEEMVELTYIGVVPAHRGRGIASRMLVENLWGACYGGYTSVVLSVDTRNTPAMKLYARHGFVEYDRREVWLATWRA
jgi:ribosomal protein S18 acetylase RimI-like enzyme